MELKQIDQQLETELKENERKLSEENERKRQKAQKEAIIRQTLFPRTYYRLSALRASR